MYGEVSSKSRNVGVLKAPMSTCSRLTANRPSSEKSSECASKVTLVSACLARSSQPSGTGHRLRQYQWSIGNGIAVSGNKKVNGEVPESNVRS